MRKALEQLAKATLADAAFLLEMAPAPTRAVMLAGGALKNVPFMREISYIIGLIDSNIWIDFVLGLPMLGWARHAPTMMRRDRVPEESIEDFMARSTEHNQKLIRRTKQSGDPKLDYEAWRKSMEEVDMGIMSKPVYSMEELGRSDVCLVRRHGFVGDAW